MLLLLFLSLLMATWSEALPATCTAVLPLLEFTFDQSHCYAGSFVDGIGDRFVLSLGGNSSATCPVFDGFSYARRGLVLSPVAEVTNNTASLLPATSSGLVAFTDPIGTDAINFTVVMWLAGLGTPGGSAPRSIVTVGSINQPSTTPVQLDVQIDSAYSLYFTVTSALGQTLTSTFTSGSFSALQGSGSVSTVVNNLASDPVFVAVTQLQTDKTALRVTRAVYVGNARTGALLRSTQTSVISSGPLTVNASTFLMLGRARYTNGSFLDGITTGEFRYLAFYKQALSLSETSAEFAKPLLTSVPAVKDTPFVLQQNETTYRFTLNTSLSTYDADGDAITHFMLDALPATGTLYVGGVAAQVQVSYPFSSSGAVTFTSASPYAYSIATNGSTCNLASAHETFRFRVSDGRDGFSAVSARAFICIVDKDVAPIAYNASLPSVHLGSSQTFLLQPFAADVFPHSLNYTPDSLQVRFTTTPLGGFGKLRVASADGLSCLGQYVTINSTYAFVQLVPASLGTGFYFCYQTYDENADLFGADQFAYEVVSSAGLVSNRAYVDTQTITALELCPSTPTRSGSSSLAGYVSPCESFGSEYPALVPIYVTGKDHLATAFGRNSTIHVSTLPAHGVLYLAVPGDDQAVGAAVTSNTTITPITSGTGPTMWYLGQALYFTRVNRTRYSNYMGLGWDGCVTRNVTCRCNLTEAPGCPDSFQFYFTVTETEEFEAENSTIGTYSIHVENVPSPVQVATSPTRILTYAALNSVSGSGYASAPVTDPPISILDPDDSAFLVGAKIEFDNAVFGRIYLDIPIIDLESDNYTIYDSGPDIRTRVLQIIFMAFPHEMNLLLAKLAVSMNGGTSKTLFVNFTKPLPSGMSEALLAVPDNLEYDSGTSVLVQRVVDSAEEARVQELSLYVLGMIILAPVCCGFLCCWLCLTFVRIWAQAAGAFFKETVCCLFPDWCVRCFIPCYKRPEPLDINMDLVDPSAIGTGKEVRTVHVQITAETKERGVTGGAARRRAAPSRMVWDSSGDWGDRA